MWKKLLISLIALTGTFTVGYAYFNYEMSAAVTPFQLQKGQKIVLGKYNDKEIVWDIGNNDNNGSYVLMSSKPLVEEIKKYDSSIGCVKYMNTNGQGAYFYECPNTVLDNEINKIVLSTNGSALLTHNFFIPDYSEIKTGGTLGLSVTDRAFKNGLKYYLNERGERPSQVSSGWRINTRTLVQSPQDGTGVGLKTTKNVSVSAGEKMTLEYDYLYLYGSSYIYGSNLRPFAAIDKSRIMFAANTSYTDGNWHDYVIDTSNLNENNELNPNKLRVQSSLTAYLQDIKYKNQSIQKVLKNSSVDLSVSANTGTNTQISVILYDDAGSTIQYYKMLAPAQSGTNDYTLDLTGVAVGKYQLAVINEEYDASSNLPVESSVISDLMPLEIVEPHKLTYTKAPQSGATRGDYEFSKNVNAGQTVGTITVNPQGIMPLTYTVESNGDNSYQNFEIDALSNGTSSSNSLNWYYVKIVDTFN